MNLLGRKKDKAELVNPDVGGVSTTDAEITRATAPKGRPTPKRSQTRVRGPVAPAPMTSSEARKRKKLNRQTLTKDERKAEKNARREATVERREKMMSGEDAYLLPRDKGRLRGFVRDVVDVRRNLLGLFMPAALGVVFITLALPAYAAVIQIAMLALILVMIADGLLIGRRVNKLVNQKFPDNTESGWKLGFYAASRASQLRRMRAPRPQVDRGAKIA